MEAIKCPNCGSEKVQAITEDKYVCLACDNVFLVYNRSKEFRQTDEHITSMHQDLKEDISKISTQNFQNLREDIGRMSDRNYLDEQATLEKAEGHMRNGAFATAFEFFSQVATDYPRRSAGWYGMYRALTGEMTQVDRYARFVCGGQYIDLQEGEEESWFEGNLYIKNALSCEDADEAKIKREVTQFIKKCAEYGKRDIENIIRGIADQLRNTKLSSAFSNRSRTKGKKRRNQLIAFLPALIIFFIVFLLVRYFLAADWLGKVIAVVIIALTIKFGHEKVMDSIGDVFAEGQSWEKSLMTLISVRFNELEDEIVTIWAYCIDLNNYNQILSDLENEDKFFQRYINDPLEGLYCYADTTREEKEGFMFNFFTGRLEEVRYLLGDDGEFFENDKEAGALHSKKKFVPLGAVAAGYLYRTIMEKTDNGAKIAEGAKNLTGKLKNLAGGEKNPEETIKSFTNGMTNLTENLQSSLGDSKGNQGHSGARFCSACGSAVEEDAVFCTKCGAKLG